MTIKIEIPSGAEFKPLALAIGEALVKYGGGATRISSAVTTEEKSALTEVPKSVETATEQASSTVTQTSAVVTASTQSFEQAVGKSQRADAATAESSTTVQDTTNNTDGSATNAQAGSVANSTIVTSGSTGTNSTEKLDEKGVGFNAQFCGNAAKPFYGSGKDKGQWKKRQGVEKPEYDAWYEASLAGESTATVGQEQQVDTAAAFNQGQGDNVQQINTASAFNGQQNGQVVNDGQNHQEQKQGGLTFADAGAFMQWLSEQQAAELITAGDIDSAYAATQSSMGDLFDPSKAADAIAAVYNFLSNIAEGQA